MNGERIYLDHAATRFPKPRATLDAMHAFSLRHEAAVGRGAYRASAEASAIVARLREEIRSWIDAESADEISFHTSGTHALNTALFGLLRNGDHVVTTAAEHNSVLRPLHELDKRGSIQWTIVPVDKAGMISVEKLLSCVQPNTRLIAVTGASNVTGTVQPVEQIGKAIVDRYSPQEKPVLLCDAAQTFAQIPISVRDSLVDVIAAPGHKGGCGPLGTGFLFVRKRLHREIKPLLFGGTGSQSDSLDMPIEYPSSVESGNLNAPALAGWLAGLREARGNQQPMEYIAQLANQLGELARSLYDAIASVDGVTLLGESESPQLPLASFFVDSMACNDVAMILDAEFGIEVRSGLHCAALIHQDIHSPADGTVRASCGEGTTVREIIALENALRELTG